ncbi:MAG: 2-oxoacid:acceptor oxidoreductase family protein [Bacillota bacterium]
MHGKAGGFKEIAEVRKLIEGTRDVIDLGYGEPNFNTPEPPHRPCPRNHRQNLRRCRLCRCAWPLPGIFYGAQHPCAAGSFLPIRGYCNVQAGRFNYPDAAALWQAIGDLTGQLLIVEATALARELGEIQVLNMVMLGALAGSGYTDLQKDTFKAAIQDLTSPKHLAANLLAFAKGYNLTIS